MGWVARRFGAGAGPRGRDRPLPPGPVDPERARAIEDLEVERLEARPVVEVAQVRELVTQRVHEARVLERPTRGRMAQADLDRAIRVADAVAAADTRALGRDRGIPEPEATCETLGVAVQALDQLSCSSAIQVRPV
jgi:hypothetical protein